MATMVELHKEHAGGSGEINLWEAAASIDQSTKKLNRSRFFDNANFIIVEIVK